MNFHGISDRGMYGMRRPPIIDTLVTGTQSEYSGKWYISKPILLLSLRERLYHAYFVIIGRATAIRFVDDL